MFDRVFIYLTTLSSNAAYLIIFGILVACGLGFPLPEDLPLIATGYLIWDGTMEWGLGVGITMAGVLIGDITLFYLGKRMGLKILDSPKNLLFKRDKIRRTRAYFRKYGDKIVFFARFVAGFRAVAFFMAGAMKMKFSRFILLDSIAAVLSVPIWIGIGYFLGYKLGDEIASVLQSARHLKHWFTIGIFTVLSIILIRIWLKYSRAKKGAGKDRRKSGGLASTAALRK